MSEHIVPVRIYVTIFFVLLVGTALTVMAAFVDFPWQLNTIVAMTGMHALHMIIGAGLITFLLIYSMKGRFDPEYHSPVEVIGLYWHFVDIIWIFLFPLLYLLGRHMEHV